MRILHIYQDKTAARNAFNELRKLGEIGANFNINEVSVSYDDVVLHFAGLEQIQRQFSGVKLDSVKYHEVEPAEEIEQFLMWRMND
jgi:hypothetical protein